MKVASLGSTRLTRVWPHFNAVRSDRVGRAGRSAPLDRYAEPRLVKHRGKIISNTGLAAVLALTLGVFVVRLCGYD